MEFQCENTVGFSQENHVLRVVEWKQFRFSSSTIRRRSHHSSCTYQGELYIYGGYDPQAYCILQDFHKFTPQLQSWEQLSSSSAQSPNRRHSHTSVVYGSSMYIYGGMISSFEGSDQLFSYNFLDGTWKKVINLSGKNPGKIDSHKAIVWKDQMIVVTGCSEFNSINIVYSLNFQTWEWTAILDTRQTGFKPRFDSAVALAGNSVFIFGGESDDRERLGDLWELDLDVCRLNQLESASQSIRRSAHTIVAYEGALLVFGGNSGVTHQRNDLMIFNLERKSWLPLWYDTKTQQPPIKVAQIQSLREIGIKQSSEDSPLKHKAKDFNKKKYRSPLKQSNTRNQLPVVAKSSKRKKKKNPREMDKQQLMATTNSHLSSSLMQTLNNSFFGMARKATVEPSKYREIKSESAPRARDGHSANMIGCQMVVFGGDWHTMGCNDVIIVQFESPSKQIDQFVGPNDNNFDGDK